MTFMQALYNLARIPGSGVVIRRNKNRIRVYYATIFIEYLVPTMTVLFPGKNGQVAHATWNSPGELESLIVLTHNSFRKKMSTYNCRISRACNARNDYAFAEFEYVGSLPPPFASEANAAAVKRDKRHGRKEMRQRRAAAQAQANNNNNNNNNDDDDDDDDDDSDNDASDDGHGPAPVHDDAVAADEFGIGDGMYVDGDVFGANAIDNYSFGADAGHNDDGDSCDDHVVPDLSDIELFAPEDVGLVFVSDDDIEAAFATMTSTGWPSGLARGLFPMPE